MKFLRLSSRHARRAALPAAALCLALGTAACPDMILGPDVEYAAASRAVDQWVQRHPQEWVLRMEGSQALARPSWSQPCRNNPPSGFVALRYQAEETEIDLFFRCPIDRSASVQDLQARFSHVALNGLPHGIDSPGWEFDVRTPSSSFSEDVTFAAAGSGRMRVSIQTPLYAVYGRSTRQSCQPPADAPMPEGCYVLREHRIPLRLTLEVPSILSGID